MQVYSETASQQISSLVDFVGYSLMLALAMIIWWGIDSGIEIKVSQVNSQVQLVDGLQVVSATGIGSNSTQASRSWVETDNIIDASWSLTAGR